MSLVLWASGVDKHLATPELAIFTLMTIKRKPKVRFENSTHSWYEIMVTMYVLQQIIATIPPPFLDELGMALLTT